MRCSLGFLLLGSLYADLSLRICGWFLGIHHADITVVWSKWWLHISFMAIIRFKCMRWNIQVIIQLTYMYIHGLHIHIYIYIHMDDTFVNTLSILAYLCIGDIHQKCFKFGLASHYMNQYWFVDRQRTNTLRSKIYPSVSRVHNSSIFFSNLLSHMWLAMCGHVCLDITVCKGVLHSYNSIEDWCINLSTHKCTCKARAVWWVLAQ